ncbi:MAG: hypothetical protein GY859_16670 [Desulfobacterales bacterium]|nr:hypothetical protein [Desulfobacterales bacterium]
MIHEPPAGPFPSLIIESGVRRSHGEAGAETPFVNDLIVLASFFPDGETPARGTLVAAEVEGCGYPVTAFVGDGVDGADACLDLNNLFGAESRVSAPVWGGEALTLTWFMGFHGMERVEVVAPVNGGQAGMNRLDERVFFIQKFME